MARSYSKLRAAALLLLLLFERGISMEFEQEEFCGPLVELLVLRFSLLVLCCTALEIFNRYLLKIMLMFVTSFWFVVDLYCYKFIKILVFSF